MCLYVLVCYSYVLVCYSYVLVCYSYVLVCYSCVLVCYSYVLVWCFSHGHPRRPSVTASEAVLPLLMQPFAQKYNLASKYRIVRINWPWVSKGEYTITIKISCKAVNEDPAWLNVGSQWRSNQPNLKNNNDEKSKTTARLTQRDIFKTIFRLARPAFFS